MLHSLLNLIITVSRFFPASGVNILNFREFRLACYRLPKQLKVDVGEINTLFDDG